jgi:hypothetical protein
MVEKKFEFMRTKIKLIKSANEIKDIQFQRNPCIIKGLTDNWRCVKERK